MNDNTDKIIQLENKLELLLKRQDLFMKEVNLLRDEISRLKMAEEEEIQEEVIIQEEEFQADENNEPIIEEKSYYEVPETEDVKKEKSDWEKIIGENLINKIGIAITVIGVGIGTKYAIDHELISPLTRIILGYLVGLGLMGFAIRLKKQYEDFSAVLLSGSMAIMYFLTYAAFDFYALIPQALAFGLMVLFTVFTVTAAIQYKRQVIAHIGLVGAYAVPFLLSNEEGNAVVLFSYMSIINFGILVIAFKQYWKPLYYSSFVFTWLIYAVWYAFSYHAEKHFGTALLFASLFYSTFYLIFLANKLIQNEKFTTGDILLILANSFIFYGFGYSILNAKHEQLLGLYTLCAAITHFIVSVVVYRRKLADRNLFYFVSGLVLIFITIAIPVQLDGNWVTLLWVGETTLLFWIGRTKQVSFYEKLAYPLMIVAFLSIIDDWASGYSQFNPEHPATYITPIFNIYFLTTILFAACFGVILRIHHNKKYPSPFASESALSFFVSIAIPGILLFTIYNAFRIEIASYWDQLYTASTIKIQAAHEEYPEYYHNDSLVEMKFVWEIAYSLLFLSVLSWANIVRLKIKKLGDVNLFLNTICIVAFLTIGLYSLSELRESYLQQTLAQYYHIGISNILIRYIALSAFVIMLLTCYRYIRQEFMACDLNKVFDLMLHTSILWSVSSELIHWLDMAGNAETYKLGLSILWGVYSLLLIALGIWKKRQYLRIGAIALFAVTLIKLFVYDISYLDTISKTVVFVSLGVLLLIISFLYNKYTHLINNESDK